MKSGLTMLLLLLVSCVIVAQDKIERKQKVSLEIMEKKSLKEVSDESGGSLIEARSRWIPSITLIGCRIPCIIRFPRTIIEEVSVKTGGLSAQYENRTICQTRIMVRNVSYL